jgi:hypothetical protein
VKNRKTQNLENPKPRCAVKPQNIEKQTPRPLSFDLCASIWQTDIVPNERNGKMAVLKANFGYGEITTIVCDEIEIEEKLESLYDNGAIVVTVTE